MSKFGASSKKNLARCHENLQRLFNEVIIHFDCSVICGHRGQAEQEDAFHKGLSKLKFPESKHN